MSRIRLLARVIVLRPEDGSAVAILAGELREPVDVAVAPDGRIFVADRAAGRIAIYDAGFRPAGISPPRAIRRFRRRPGRSR